jgi:hypothetical protein
MADTVVTEKKECRHPNNNGMLSGAYGLAFLGALFYFLQHATSFWVGVLGVIKAIFWPAVLIYKVLERLGM